MSWFYSLTIRTKLLIPIVIISLMTITIGALSLYQFAIIDSQVKLLGAVNLQAANYLLEADTDVHKVLVEERSMLFLNPESPDFGKSVIAHGKNMDAAHKKLLAFRELIKDPSIAQHFEAYEQARDRWETLSKSVVSARLSNTREGRSTAIEVSFKDGNIAFSDMRSQIYTLKEQLQNRSISIMHDSEESVTYSNYMVSIAIGLTFSIACIMALLIPKLILQPIQAMREFIKKMAGDGSDLTQKIPVNYHDELGELGHTINDFFASLRTLIAQVINIGSLFHQQSSTLKTLAEKNSSVVQKETHEISLVASAITQLNQSVKGVAQLAQEASTKTGLARNESGGGIAVVTHTINAINQLAEKVKSSSNVISELNADSANIIGVVNVIKGIADQINLLALNAAIEAARAGDQGRGFAVVADSVRELAVRTADSTQEIQVIISKLQASASLAVEAMQQSQTIALESVTQAGATGVALSQIDESVKRLSHVNDQISIAAGQQSTVAGEISGNTSNIAQYARDSAHLAQDVAQASDQLEKVAGTLHTALSKFRI